MYVFSTFWSRERKFRGPVLKKHSAFIFTFWTSVFLDKSIFCWLFFSQQVKYLLASDFWWDLSVKFIEDILIMSCFSFAAFRIVSLSFASLIIIHLGVGLWVYSAWSSLRFLDLEIHICHQMLAVFDHSFFKYSFWSFWDIHNARWSFWWSH